MVITKMNVEKSLKLLGLKTTRFTKEELTDAYRNKAKEYHTDINPDIDPSIMYRINEANEILKEYLKIREKETEKERNIREMNLYKEEVEEIAKFFGIGHEEIIYRFYAYQKRTSFEGTILDYYQGLYDKYASVKEEAFKLFNRIKPFDGDYIYIVERYEQFNENKNLTIIEWLKRYVMFHEVNKLLETNPKDIKDAYKNDKKFGYKGTLESYIERIHDTILEGRKVPNFTEIRNKKIYSKLHNGIDRKYIDILEIEMIKDKYGSDSDGILLMLAESLKNSDNDTLYQSIIRIIEKGKEKVYSKKQS